MSSCIRSFLLKKKQMMVKVLMGLGLCLFFALSFKVVPAYASQPVFWQTWDIWYKSSDEFVSHTSEFPNDLEDLMYISWDLSDVDKVSWNNFKNALDNIGFLPYIAAWDPYNPQFYIEVVSVEDNWDSITGVLINFSHSANNGNVFVNPSGSSRYVSMSGYWSFIQLDRFGQTVLLRPSKIDQVPETTNLSGSTSRWPWADRGFITSDSSDFTFFCFDQDFQGYAQRFPASNDVFLSDFLEWLDDPNAGVFRIYLAISSDGSLSRSNSLWGLNYGPSDLYNVFTPVFSLYSIYNLNTSSYSLVNNRWGSSVGAYKFFTYIADSELTPFCYKFNNGYNIESTVVLPTPFPTFSPLYSPTPFPSVTMSPTLTPIGLYYNPELDFPGGGDSLIGQLMGYISFLTSYLRSDQVRFFSTVIEYIYQSSIFFRFMLLVPIICLVAYIIGRFKRK